MAPELKQTLAMVAGAANEAVDPWWIIGSAAVALHGSPIERPRDVDLLMSARDADALLRKVGQIPRCGEPDDRFSSKVFGIWTQPPIPVEVMGGLSLHGRGGWEAVEIATREPVEVGSNLVFAPSAEELILMLEAFGRPKDRERARLLRR